MALTHEEIEFAKNEYYKLAGWTENGVPTSQTMERLDIAWAIVRSGRSNLMDYRLLIDGQWVDAGPAMEVKNKYDGKVDWHRANCA